VKVAELLPDGIVIEAGTLAEMLFELRFTTAPLGPAGPVSVTVPVEGEPPRTEVGLRLTVLRVEAVMARAAVCLSLARVAVIVADAFESTPVVVTVTVAEVAPLATVTELGTAAELSELESATASPALGAGPEMVTVPVDDVPAGTVVGFRERDTRVGAVTIRLAESVTEFKVPEICTVAFDATGIVVMAKVAVLFPAGTTTLAPTVATFVFELLSATVHPDGPAMPASVTVPVDDVPP